MTGPEDVEQLLVRDHVRIELDLDGLGVVPDAPVRGLLLRALQNQRRNSSATADFCGGVIQAWSD